MQPIAEMNAAEREEIKTQIAYAETQLLSAKFSTAELELWDTLREIFNTRRNLPLTNFVKGKGLGLQRYHDCSKALEAMVTKACRGTRKPDRAMRVAMRRLLLDCLCQCLTAGNVLLSPTVLLLCFDKLEYAADQAYPGYIEAGMLTYALTPLPKSIRD
jgi:hypothetical protein